MVYVRLFRKPLLGPAKIIILNLFNALMESTAGGILDFCSLGDYQLKDWVQRETGLERGWLIMGIRSIKSRQGVKKQTLTLDILVHFRHFSGCE